MLPLRALAVVILIAAAGGVALLTTKVKQPLLLPVKREPKSVRSFGRLAGETLRTTLIVAAVTPRVMSLILWGLDGIILVRWYPLSLA